ncbi:MAG: metal ABC transporter permease [Bacteroidota bacterium]|nr:metal ABC transporter permease [Bacteroidota bacterium]
MSDIEIIKSLFHDFPFALFGSILVGLVCSFIGVYIISKRIVFVGAALTQVSMMGLAFAFLPFIHFNPFFTSLVSTLLAVGFLSRIIERKILPADAILGLTFVTAIAMRILFLQKSYAVETAEIENLLRGDVLFVTAEKFYIILITATVILSTHFIFYRKFVFIALDPETAATQGFNVKFWDVLLFLTIGITIAVATQVAGDLFVFGFLIIPTSISLLIFKKVKYIFLGSVAIGIILPIIGLFFSFKFDFPVGPTTIGSALILLISAFIVKYLKS